MRFLKGCLGFRADFGKGLGAGVRGSLAGPGDGHDGLRRALHLEVRRALEVRGGRERAPDPEDLALPQVDLARALRPSNGCILRFSKKKNVSG